MKEYYTVRCGYAHGFTMAFGGPKKPGLTRTKYQMEIGTEEFAKYFCNNFFIVKDVIYLRKSYKKCLSVIL